MQDSSNFKIPLPWVSHYGLLWPLTRIVSLSFVPALACVKPAFAPNTFTRVGLTSSKVAALFGASNRSLEITRQFILEETYAAFESSARPRSGKQREAQPSACT